MSGGRCSTPPFQHTPPPHTHRHLTPSSLSPALGGPQLYISSQHAQAEGTGIDSPGPGAYDHNTVELADVTSRYRKPAAAAFGTSARFKSGVMTF